MSIFFNPVYRKDEDLEFLQYMPSKDLDDLVYVLTHDPRDGETRFSEELTTSSNYKKYYPDHNKYWKEIATEIQTFGANTFATIFRGGEGVLYKEVLMDVCDKLSVNYNKKSKTEVIENNLLMKVLVDSMEKMSKDDLRKLGEELGIKNSEFITPEIITSGFLAIFKAGGFKSYQVTITIVNRIVEVLVGRGLSFAVNAMIPQILKVLTGPIGWVITGLWTVWDIAGPAYRVTIPVTFIVAALRKKYLYGMNY